MRTVALTGSAGAGKSTVAGLFRQWGVSVIDADELVRELQRPGERVLADIVARFGREVLLSDGTLNRVALRRRVFGDTKARKSLEAIVHPAVEARRQQLVAEARARGAQLVIVDIPLLFESANPGAYDGVIVVDAPTELRRRRLVEQRGYTEVEAEQLMKAQLPASEKRARATWVIDNDAGLDVLEARAKDVWQRLQR